MIAERPHRTGFVLLVTLVLLVVLAWLGYMVSSMVSSQRRRSQYIIDYQASRYACDSAVKYALDRLPRITPALVARPNVPDFSDIFRLSEPEYQQLLDEVAAIRAAEANNPAYGDYAQPYPDTGAAGAGGEVTDPELMDVMKMVLGGNDVNGPNDFNDANGWASLSLSGYPAGSNDLFVPGPYGPAWPNVIKPIELEIGTAKVTIRIEDENAKYPIGWMLMDDKQREREVRAGFETFCAWMDANETDVAVAEQALEELRQLKPFKIKFKEKVQRRRVGGLPSGSSQRGSRISRLRSSRQRYTTTRISPAAQQAQQAADFARLLHSSLLDAEPLARPTIVTDSRCESPLKYIGTWGSTRVNINTAPRHVLEAAFVFGGDEVDIADQIIARRRIKPFKDIDELKSELLRYSDSIRKCEDFITTRSTFFTVRITAVSGLAESSAVVAVVKTGKNVRKIAMISS